MKTMQVCDIRVGKRHRKELGDVDALARSIETVGLLHPIVVLEDGLLVAGERRLEAVQRLRWEEVPVHIVHGLNEAVKLLLAERDENTCRKDFTPTEAVAMKRSLTPVAKEEAKQRQRAAGSRGKEGGRGKKKENPSEDSSEGFSRDKPAPQSREEVAAAVGLSFDTLNKAETVVAYAEEDPETFGPIAEEMDRTGNVEGAFRKAAREKKRKAAPPPPTPEVIEAVAEIWRVDGPVDCLEWFSTQPADSLSLVFGSPPYEQARLYLENGEDTGIARSTTEWVEWMVKVYQAALRCCTGLVAFVVEGQTKQYRWSAAPVLLMARLHEVGIHLRKPPIYQRVGIPGSGGPDWLRNDYEFIVCATRGGQLPWSDNTAMGVPPKFDPGGDPSHRTQDGSRVNGSVGYASMGDRNNVGPHRARQQAGRKYEPPEVANPGNVISCSVGGGNMGDELCHENEAPFPESLAEFFVRSFCPPGGVVCDPFSGSGTTGKMAVQWGRRFLGCDIRASQVELSRRRLASVQQELFKE